MQINMSTIEQMMLALKQAEMAIQIVLKEERGISDVGSALLIKAESQAHFAIESYKFDAFSQQKVTVKENA